MDREKVIKGMAMCISQGECSPDDCPYYDRPDNASGLCWDRLMTDALSLLKEQETKWIHREDLDFKDKLGCNHFHGMCGNCGFIHDFIDDHTGQYKYCPQCGQAVKWE